MNKEEFSQLIQAARQADLLLFFQSSGYTVEKKGGNYYVKDYPGLCIQPENNQWYHHYTNVGRTNNSLDCLTLVCGRSFNQAVYELTGQDVTAKRAADFEKKQAPQYTTPPEKATPVVKEKKALQMPEQAPNMRRLYAYFCQSRKIPSAIVEEFVHAKLLYQSENTVNTTINGVAQTFQNANAVFIHKNANGDIIGGEIQGLNSFKRYKGIAAGTGESAFIFAPVPSKDGNPKRAYIFESAIDLMSFYTFCDKTKIEGALFVSMAGLKPSVPNKLQETGVSIISCVDNDDSGRRFESENGFHRSESVKAYLDDKGFKDWNELLVFKSENPNANFAKKVEAPQEKKQEQPQFNMRGRR